MLFVLLLVSSTGARIHLRLGNLLLADEPSTVDIISHECICSGHISEGGLGECRTSYQERHFCYVRRGSKCLDIRWSSKNGHFWSYEPCKRATKILTKNNTNTSSERRQISNTKSNTKIVAGSNVKQQRSQEKICKQNCFEEVDLAAKRRDSIVSQRSRPSTDYDYLLEWGAQNSR